MSNQWVVRWWLDIKTPFPSLFLQDSLSQVSRPTWAIHVRWGACLVYDAQCIAHPRVFEVNHKGHRCYFLTLHLSLQFPPPLATTKGTVPPKHSWWWVGVCQK